MTTVSPTHNHQRGFTLIELVVTAAILLTITGSGIATMLDFNDRQQLREAGKNVESLIKGARTRAQIGDVPEQCFSANDSLRGYRVQLAAGSSIVLVQVLCGGQTLTTDQVDLSNVTAVNASQITFLPLYGGVQGASTIELAKDNLIYRFSVTQQGEVTAGEISND